MSRGTGAFAAVTRPVSRFVAFIVRPRATDRDVAFREQVIRSTLAISIVLALMSLSLNIFVFKSDRSLVSYFTMHIVALVGCFTSAALVVRGHIRLSSWFLVLTFLFGVNSLLVLGGQSGSFASVMNATLAFSFVPIVATLVLPRNMIIPVSLLSVLTYAISQFGFSGNAEVMTHFRAGEQIPSVFVALFIEGAMLRQLRVEFDDRFEAMRESARQKELAKQDAEAARLRAEEADQAKTQFLANMSHELRTPLNAVIGYDEIMLGGMAGEFTPKQTDLLRRIQQNSRRLLGLINEVLDLSKIESGAVEVYLAPLSPDKIITETVESLRSLAQEKHIELIAEMDATLPSLILGDANKIQQILVNLISNAVKFTETGSVTVRARSIGQTEWQFSVTDTGIGMPPDAVTYIFKPFKQVDSSVTRKYKGTGLGLSISKRLIEIMGGTVQVESALGRGSTFTITLPRAALPEAESAVSNATPHEG